MPVDITCTSVPACSERRSNRNSISENDVTSPGIQESSKMIGPHGPPHLNNFQQSSWMDLDWLKLSPSPSLHCQELAAYSLAVLSALAACKPS